MSLQNDLILRAARGEKTERTPVWLMRQAGRILPEYRALRNSLSGFIELVKSPELAAEVT
ncbi:MAG: uroporphyrinogen decarboxylase, partial [Bacteroidota bacterium]|nr:uroporphyrinogen decarboxylase [Bacteroidota bacterium]